MEFDADRNLLAGRVEGLSEPVSFETREPREVEEVFHAAVDEYLDTCRKNGRNPDKVYKGSFNVRISPQLHRQLAELAARRGESLNTAVEKAIRRFVADEDDGTL